MRSAYDALDAVVAAVLADATADAIKTVLGQMQRYASEGMTEEEYFTKNYEAASRNPYIYGYMQFRQFIKIYEDKSLPDFDTYIKTYLKKKQ